MTTSPESLLNTEVHFLGHMVVATSPYLGATSSIMRRGDVLTITDDVIEGGYDRRRAHWLELIDDDNAQIERYGVVKYQRGPWPEYMSRFDPNDPTQAEFAAMGSKHSITSTTTKGARPERGTFTALQGDVRKDATR